MKIKQPIIAAIAMVLFIAAIIWSNISLSELDIEISENQNKLRELQAEMSSAGALLARLNQYDSIFTHISGELYPSSKSIELIKNIGRIAESHQLSLNDFQFEIPEYINQINYNQSNVQVIPFKCILEGDFIYSGKFIESIEKKHFIDNIHNIKCNLSASANINTISIIDGNLRLFDTNNLRKEALYE